MKKQPAFIPAGLESLMDARQHFRLSHAHVQMARELGMNPKKLGKLANHDQEPWKLPLPQFIAALYVKRFGKARPDTVRTMEEIASRSRQRRRGARRANQRLREGSSPLTSVSKPIRHQIAVRDRRARLFTQRCATASAGAWMLPNAATGSVALLWEERSQRDD